MKEKKLLDFFNEYEKIIVKSINYDFPIDKTIDEIYNREFLHYIRREI